MAEYEKIKRATLPLNDEYLLLISMEVDADHNSIISSILNLIEKQ
jgi:hypothetical protein